MTLKQFFKLVTPSILGVLLFLIPMSIDGKPTVAIAALAALFKSLISPISSLVLLIVIAVGTVLPIVLKLLHSKPKSTHPLLKMFYEVSWSWILVRVIGLVFTVMIYFEFGPEFVTSSNTGKLVFDDLLPSLLSMFLFAGLFLPLLLEYGLLEFVGALMTPIMRPLFNLPGRSAIDCLASWLGDGSVGILLTAKQYEDGHYTEREAAVIATTFSAVSITFGLVVLAQVKLTHMFLPFYACVCVAGLFAAVVLPHLPPLSRKKNHRQKQVQDEKVSAVGFSACVKEGWRLALRKSDSIDHFVTPLGNGLVNAAEMIFGVIPVIIAIGTCSLILAEYTSLFDLVGKPFIPVLEWLNIAEAAQASRALFVGFADMFVPSILVTNIASDQTRFIIACLSVTQLIYMSEVGALLLGSKIPVNFVELLSLFVLRTVLTLPVIVFMSQLFF